MELVHGQILKCSNELDLKIKSETFEIDGGGIGTDKKLFGKLFKTIEAGVRFASQRKKFGQTEGILPSLKDKKSSE